MRTANIINPNNNRAIANQFVIENGNSITFQSYDSEIVTIDNTMETIYVGADYNYSTTTSKWRNVFMAEYTQFGAEMGTTKGFEKALKDGFVDNGYHKYKVVKM